MFHTVNIHDAFNVYHYVQLLVNSKSNNQLQVTPAHFTIGRVFIHYNFLFGKSYNFIYSPE